ncbi:DNA-binding domain-containing protein [Simiduia agarivorans]|uniref:Uncharacterized protein n=1 Tax=Simiduia agarivorans (strain DSM 21679 / JCM 13881 / BCRC 17597 / SA1) TaxID=1117647 RepID=K4KRB6_SIMAS|nr:putative DNA-binding domain-containing protein [Simiduia agarivorans]AFV00826.1 hypothetical protein M5M_18485 [Simiduia agarivorans SA1 = DSM 21679]
MATSSPLAEQQVALTRYLRNPEQEVPPQGMEPRRLKIYEELLFNNVEGFLNSGFPVFRSLLADDDWVHLVRQFFVLHRAHTPYFLEIGEEFRTFIDGVDLAGFGLPAFVPELLHYEWVELALDVSDAVLPPERDQQVDHVCRLQLSPLAVVLAYHYPVQQIGPGYQPGSPPAQPTFLAVHRDRSHRVRFVALNGLTYALLNSIEQSDEAGISLGELASSLYPLVHGTQAEPMPDVFQEQVKSTLQQLADQQILFIC